MKLDRRALLLYAVTDRSWLKDTTLAEAAEEAIKGGATMLQYREKHICCWDLLMQAKELKAVARKYNVPFIVNDNLNVALASEADGIHVGQRDMDAAEARRKIGPNKILGVSVSTPEEARAAELAGADYLGTGAVFPTGTKPDAGAVSIETLKKICEAVSIPVVAIGGINPGNIMELKDSGAAGAAVVSALFSAGDVAGAAAELRRLSESMVGV